MVVMKPGLALDSGVDQVPKVKPSDVRNLASIGVKTVRDLLLYLPFDWETYGDPVSISKLVAGTTAFVIGTISTIAPHISQYKKLKMTRATLHDDDDEALTLVWFNQPWVAKQVQKGDRIAVAGLVRAPTYRGMEMRNPHYEKLGDGAYAGPNRIRDLMPKYHLVKGITSKKLSEWVTAVLPLAEKLEDELPVAVRARHRLLSLPDAVKLGQQPETIAEWKEARRRLGFDELFELQAAFALMRANLALEQAVPIPYRQEVIDAFKAGLGFELTRAQKRATWEVFQDMARGVPMNRLLNGDVGSGKTAVAAACAAMAHAAGQQSVVMAPTEILARQHLTKFRGYLEASFPGLTVELLVSSQGAAERRRVRAAAASGHCALVVGTHALIEEDVEFADLGLAVVDEQHRFGTRQRELLRAKGKGRPHFLAMTATPIPRTLALARFGEMSLSVIDEMPPGRTPVETRVVPPDRRLEAYDIVRAQVVQGRQAFIICPLIEESEKVIVRSATAEFDRLRADVFPDLTMDLIHGRLKNKDEVMKRFAAGEVQVLVATAVVEVGVDVPNATVMMVEGADRFGLAQLHQFRGRIGRGAAGGCCLLLADDPSETSMKRLNLVTAIGDGFKLAEEDMRLRGMGELLGARQHGVSDEAMENLQNPDLINEIREEVEAMRADDPTFDRHPVLKTAIDRRLALTSIS
jgi:ATP-dependent DNA helicase RecG